MTTAADRLLNFVIAAFGTIVLLAILAAGVPLAAIIRAFRWCVVRGSWRRQ